MKKDGCEVALFLYSKRAFIGGLVYIMTALRRIMPPTYKR